MTTEEIYARYKKISAKQAKEVFDTPGDYTILDVRRQDEYDAGHIKNSVLVPIETITPLVLEEHFPDKKHPIYIYCRAGHRSADVAFYMIEQGYENIYDFGGLETDWTYDLEK